MSLSAHIDTFARDHLPPRDQWPELLYELPELQFPATLNCAAELLDKAATALDWGERIALRGPNGTLSYRELLATANRIAHVLQDDLGLVPGNRVLLRGGNSPMLAACWFAVQKAGGVAVATMPQLRAKELTDVVVKAQVTHALCDRALLDDLTAVANEQPILRHLLTFHGPMCGDGLEARMSGKPADFVNVDTAADDISLIAFTSGTTGKPKGAMHSHRDLMAACACFPRSILKAVSDDVFCGTPPLAFTFGLGGLLLFPLSVGASSVLLEKLTPAALLEAIGRHKATVCFTAPTFYRMMADSLTDQDISSLGKCVSAGEALPVATRLRWEQATGLRIIDGIGSTELLHIFISAGGNDIRPGATGKVIPGYRAALFDAAGSPVPPGEVGRLAIKGPTGCRYLDDARQTEYVRNGWNFTGDAYLMDRDGYFIYQARTDDMIISAGYNISGPEVEDVLLTHPAVAECGVVGVADPARGQVVKACVVLRTGYAAGEALAGELQEFVKQTIAPYKYPRLIEFREALPRTATGKLQRFVLRNEAARR